MRKYFYFPLYFFPGTKVIGIFTNLLPIITYYLLLSSKYKSKDLILISSVITEKKHIIMTR